jgi:hypothetical protein
MAQSSKAELELGAVDETLWLLKLPVSEAAAVSVLLLIENRCADCCVLTITASGRERLGEQAMYERTVRRDLRLLCDGMLTGLIGCRRRRAWKHDDHPHATGTAAGKMLGSEQPCDLAPFVFTASSFAVACNVQFTIKLSDEGSNVVTDYTLESLGSLPNMYAFSQQEGGCATQTPGRCMRSVLFVCFC